MHILILLVGTNPLPNYVVGRYFTEINPWADRIFLIHAAENANPLSRQASTEVEARSIKKALNLLKVSIDLISLTDVSDINTIETDIKGFTIGEIGNTTTVAGLLGRSKPDIHVNFTGGTKAMTLGVCNCFRNLSLEYANIRFSSSYLNARNNTLILGEGDHLPGLENTKKIRSGIDRVLHSIDTFIDLHDFIKDTDPPKYCHPELYQLLKDELKGTGKIESVYAYILIKPDTTSDASNRLRKHKKGVLLTLYIEDLVKVLQLANSANVLTVFKRFQERITDRAYVTLKENLSGYLAFHAHNPDPNYKRNFVQAVLQLLNTLETAEVNEENAIAFAGLRHVFTDATFLEEHVYQCMLLAQVQIPELRDIRKNLIVKRKNDSRSARFELDVVGCLGIRFVAISVTTRALDYNKAEDKLKGFEIIHRAQQVGGDNALAILVCRSNQNYVSILESTLREEMGSTLQNFFVLGEDAWKNLEENLLTILRNFSHA